MKLFSPRLFSSGLFANNNFGGGPEIVTQLPPFGIVQSDNVFLNPGVKPSIDDLRRSLRERREQQREKEKNKIEDIRRQTEEEEEDEIVLFLITWILSRR